MKGIGNSYSEVSSRALNGIRSNSRYARSCPFLIKCMYYITIYSFACMCKCIEHTYLHGRACAKVYTFAHWISGAPNEQRKASASFSLRLFYTLCLLLSSTQRPDWNAVCDCEDATRGTPRRRPVCHGYTKVALFSFLFFLFLLWIILFHLIHSAMPCFGI